jgi:hypothetical protein
MGLIVSDGTSPSRDGRVFVTQPGLYDDAQIPGWRAVGPPPPRPPPPHKKPPPTGSEEVGSQRVKARAWWYFPDCRRTALLRASISAPARLGRTEREQPPDRRQGRRLFVTNCIRSRSGRGLLRETPTLHFTTLSATVKSMSHNR